MGDRPAHREQGLACREHGDRVRAADAALAPNTGRGRPRTLNDDRKVMTIIELDAPAQFATIAPTLVRVGAAGPDHRLVASSELEGV